MNINSSPRNRKILLSDCPLCTIPFRERLIYVDDRAYICETKDKKGHKTRIMIVSFEHGKEACEKFEQYAVWKLVEIGSKIFTEGWIIVRGMTSVPDHWHLIAEDESSTDPRERELLKTISIIWKSE